MKKVVYNLEKKSFSEPEKKAKKVKKAKKQPKVVPTEEPVECVALNELTTEEVGQIPETYQQVEFEPEKPRIINFHTDLNEETAGQIVSAMLNMHHNSRFHLIDEAGSSKIYQGTKPLDFYISTFGGSAVEMFGIHDLMVKLRDEMPIRTFGLGKVMSAGVLLLASGTSGCRYVGRHTRLMIHSLQAGYQGPMHELETEYEETHWLQKQYFRVLSEHTNMSQKFIKKLMDRHTNVYISAEQAIEFGIADEMM